jgi:hypothetical protein
MDTPDLRGVYQAERQATGSLLHYYRRSMEADFDEVLASVKAFAKADASRLSLRARLRAGALAEGFQEGKDTYIEAGYIHYPLYRYLRRETGGGKIRVIYLLQPVFDRLGCKRRNMGPGDILTLHYALGSRITDHRADLLAARSLIYVKLIQKEERVPGPSEAPHAEDEAPVNRLVDGLTLADCRDLFPEIRFKGRDEALGHVRGRVPGT